jgi:hypothetical protein
MSIQSQAILPGHLSPHDVLAAVQQLSERKVVLRSTHKPTYWLLEMHGPDGVEAAHLFLESSVAEDYIDVTVDPSTFLSIACSPVGSDVLRALAQRLGGHFRRTELDPWGPVDLTSMPTL